MMSRALVFLMCVACATASSSMMGISPVGSATDIDKKVENMSVKEALDAVSQQNPELQKMFLKAKTMKRMGKKMGKKDVKALEELLLMIKAEIEAAADETFKNFVQCFKRQQTLRTDIAENEASVKSSQATITFAYNEIMSGWNEFMNLLNVWDTANLEMGEFWHTSSLQLFEWHLASRDMKKRYREMRRTLKTLKCEAKSAFVQVECFEDGSGQRFKTVPALGKVHKSLHSDVQSAFAQAVHATKKDRMLASENGEDVTLAQVKEHTHEQKPKSNWNPVKQTDPAGSPQKVSCQLDEEPSCHHLMAYLLALYGETEDEFILHTEKVNTLKEERERRVEAYHTQIDFIWSEIGRQFSRMYSGIELSLNTTNEKLGFEMMIHDLHWELIQLHHQCVETHDTIELGLCGSKKLRAELLFFFEELRKKLISTTGTDAVQDCVLQMTPTKNGVCQSKIRDGEQICISADDTLAGAVQGGVQKWYRNAVNEPSPIYGAICKNQEFETECGTSPCPIDCEVSSWGAWSECSKECDKGMKSRTRSVTQPSEHGGEKCPGTNDSAECNTESCNADCVEGNWLKPSECSASCDVGYQSRWKEIVEPERGTGTCPGGGRTIHDLHETERCNVHDCIADEYICNTKMNIGIVVESSDAMAGENDWERNKSLVVNLLEEFARSAKNMIQITLINAGGATSLENWDACQEQESAKCNGEAFACRETTDKDCDYEKLVSDAKGMKLKGGANGFANGVAMASAEMTLRGDADGTNVLVLVATTQPDSVMRTARAVREIRKTTRVMAVLVGSEAENPDGGVAESWKEIVSKDKDLNMRYVTPEMLDQGDESFQALAEGMLVSLCPVVKEVESEESDSEEETEGEEGSGFLF